MLFCAVCRTKIRLLVSEDKQSFSIFCSTVLIREAI